MHRTAAPVDIGSQEMPAFRKRSPSRGGSRRMASPVPKITKRMRSASSMIFRSRSPAKGSAPVASQP